MNTTEYRELKKMLQERPGEALVIPDGTALAMLAGPELDKVLVVLAPTGRNFAEMTAEQIDDYIVSVLKK